VANYDVSIRIAIAGAKELDRVNKQTEKLRSSITQVNKVAEASGKKPVRNFNNLSKSVQEARDALDEAAIGTKEFNQAVKNLVTVENKFNRAQKNKNRDLKVEAIRRKEGLTLQQAKNKISQQELELENKLANAKARTAKKERSKRIGGTISSAAIGGAFPLLFGQSGTAAVGGAVGGAAGGLIGGQFGFALSILGTAVGQFIDEQDKLDRSLSKISRSFVNAGNSAGFTRESFNNLRKTTKMTKDEVLGVASSFARFGEAGEAAAFIFGDNPQTFKNLAAMNNTKTLMTAILDEQNGLNIEQQIQLLQEAKITSFKDMQLKVNRLILEENYKRELAEARQISNQDKILDFMKQYYKLLILTTGFQPGAVFDKIFKGIFQKDKLEEELQAVEDMVEKVFPDIFNTSAENAETAAAEITKYYEKLFDALPEVQDLISDLNLQVEGMSYSIPSAIDSVSAELRKLMSVGYMVTTTANTIGDAFGESFKGIVKGSMTAQDALRNLFQRTADAFLDMAARIIAEQIRLKILGIGLKFFGGGTNVVSETTDIFAGKGLTAAEPGEVTYKNFEKFANGGRPPVGRPSIVGERGAELFVPDRAGTIIPNHQLGGSTNIVVNVDASGSSVEGDEEQGRELGRMISVAIQSELIKQKRPGGMLA